MTKVKTFQEVVPIMATWEKEITVETGYLSESIICLHYQDADKDPACGLLKNAQIQGARNPEE
jgi:hypothetical protein